MENNNKDNKAILETSFISKHNITAKKLIKASTLIMGLILIVFMTVSNIIFEPDKLDFFKWFTNALISTGIMVFGLLIGESIGHDRQSENAKGLYQKNLKAYNTFRQSIDAIELYFSQFFLWYKEKELIKKKIDWLVNNSFDGQWAKMLVLYSNKNDLQIGKLIKNSENDKIYITTDGIKLKKIENEQAEIVKKIYEMKLNTPEYSYFLTAFDSKSMGGVLEQGTSLKKQIKSDKRFNRILKIASALFISLVWGMATVGDFADESAKMQAWFNLISRLTALLTAFSSGWASSVLTVKTEAEMIENKQRVLKYFKQTYESGEFKALTYEEEVEKEYAKIQAEKNKTDKQPRKIKTTAKTPKNNEKQKKRV